jgi:peptidoglycan/LPS O-acetylase OafA/YrhL
MQKMSAQMKKILEIIAIILVFILIAARIFFPFTPPWMDVIFLVCIVAFLVIVMLAPKKTEGSKGEKKF